MTVIKVQLSCTCLAFISDCGVTVQVFDFEQQEFLEPLLLQLLFKSDPTGVPRLRRSVLYPSAAPFTGYGLDMDLLRDLRLTILA